jgi:hypothetical protein
VSVGFLEKENRTQRLERRRVKGKENRTQRLERRRVKGKENRTQRLERRRVKGMSEEDGRKRTGRSVSSVGELRGCPRRTAPNREHVSEGHRRQRVGRDRAL